MQPHANLPIEPTESSYSDQDPLYACPDEIMDRAYQRLAAACGCDVHRAHVIAHRHPELMQALEGFISLESVIAAARQAKLLTGRRP